MNDAVYPHLWYSVGTSSERRDDMNSGYAGKVIAGFADGFAFTVEESVSAALGDFERYLA